MFKRIKAIKQVRYDNGISQYILITGFNKNGYDFTGYVNINLARVIAKKQNIIIEKAKEITIPLGFVPKSIKNNNILS